MSQIIETLQLPGSTDEYQFRALKLKKTTNGIGSSDTPVYINAEGEPVACSSSITSDTKVTQTNTTDSADFRVLFGGTADNTTRTEGARKSSELTFNPNTHNLKIQNSGTGDAILSFIRGTESDSTYDYRLKSSGGMLYTQLLTSGSSSWENKMYISSTNSAILHLYPMSTLTYDLGHVNYLWNNIKSKNYLAKGGNIKIETSNSTAGGVMSYDSAEECIKFLFE